LHPGALEPLLTHDSLVNDMVEGVNCQ
jgi:hypothetical protein